MAIASTDLLIYGSLYRPEDDTSTSGGTVTTLHRPEFTELPSNTTVVIVSSASDTRNVTITGRTTAGAVTDEVIALNGTTGVTSTTTFERLTKVVAASTHATTTVTVKTAAGVTISQIPPMELGFYRLFLNSASDTSPVTRYEKIYWKNAHASLTLNAAKVTLTADPDSRIRIGLDASKNATLSVANRLSAPGGVSFVDDSVEQNVPATTLEAGSVIGVWIEQALEASDAPFKSSLTTRLAGTSV